MEFTNDTNSCSRHTSYTPVMNKTHSVGYELKALILGPVCVCVMVSLYVAEQKKKLNRGRAELQSNLKHRANGRQQTSQSLTHLHCFQSVNQSINQSIFV